MSVYYLIDAHTTPITDSEINDVLDSRTDLLTNGNAAAVVNGNFVVRVGDDQRLAADPTSLSDLLVQKYDGLKEKYGFNNVLYDSLLESSGIATSGDRRLGFRGAIGSLGNTLATTMQVASGPIGAVVVVVDFFRWKYLNPKDGRLLRIYEEVPISEYPGISISANNGGDFTTVTSGVTTSIPVGETGTQVILNFSAPSFNDPILIGSWAVIY